MDFRDFFAPAAIAANWNEALALRDPYLGRTLFDTRKKAGLDLKWLRGSRGLPVSLMPSAFDAKATFRDRIGLEGMEEEMPFFREGYKIKERDRQELLRIREANDPYLDSILGRLFDDVNDLIAGAAVVPERMIMQLLFPVDGNAGIAIKANGVDYTYNYDEGGTWKRTNYIVLTNTDTWDSPDTADPFKAIKQGKDAVRAKTGAEIAVAIMNSNTFNLMANIAAVKNRFLTTSGMTFGYLTDEQLRNVVENTVGVRIVVYDKMYRDEDKVQRRFVPDGYVSLIPAGNLGTVWYGTTPEEADLMGGNSNAQVSIVDTGVAITRILEEHPVNTNIFASEIVLPSFERMDDVALLKVTA